MVVKKLVIFVACMVAWPAFAQDANKTPIIPAPTQSFGRYQIVFSPFVRADTFLLDTQTGKIWQMVRLSDVKGQPSVWEFMPKLDNTLDEIDFVKAQGGIETPPPQRSKKR